MKATGIGTFEHGLDRIGRRILAGIDLAFIERGHDAVGAARDRNYDKIDAFAAE